MLQRIANLMGPATALAHRGVITAFFALAWTLSPAEGAVPASGLTATARGGQVFLTWREAATPQGTTFNVYKAATPISDVTKAERIAHHVEAHSARDWWEDPASFKKHVPAGKSVGFRIQESSGRLDPQGGLFVHTVGEASKGKLFFAITCSDDAGKEDTTVVAGANSLTEGVAPVAGEIKPIWQHEAQQPAVGGGKAMPLWLELHAKGGVVANMEYLVFGDETMGWREGLPFKFSVRIEGGEVIVRPTDRVWINRPHQESSDGGSNAIWTFWYGYNSNIYDLNLMAAGVPTNYTERRNLWILKWVREYYQPDPNRWHCSGGSMGGCGTMSFAFRHPELFAACHARVPIVSYTYVGANSATRLEPSCWTGPITPEVKTDEGVPLLERMNGVKFVTESKDDLPFVFLLNGRKDGSIPWENNPPFYRAMSEARQGFAAYWDDGAHATCGKDAPADVQAWAERFRSIRSDESYPAFSHTSSDRNPGNGAPTDGDIVGWINRGMDWKDIEDASDHYSILLLADYPGVEYPVRTDVTLRRTQHFKTRPSEPVRVSVGGGRPISVVVDSTGHLTIPKLSIPSKDGIRVTIRRS